MVTNTCGRRLCLHCFAKLLLDGSKDLGKLARTGTAATPYIVNSCSTSSNQLTQILAAIQQQSGEAAQTPAASTALGDHQRQGPEARLLQDDTKSTVTCIGGKNPSQEVLS